MRWHPSSPRGNYTSSAPSCSSITHLRYWVGGNWLAPAAVPPWLPHSVCHLLSQLTLAACPQACKNNICLDLSPGHRLDGRLTGHRVETWDVKVCVPMRAVCAGSVNTGTCVCACRVGWEVSGRQALENKTPLDPGSQTGRSAGVERGRKRQAAALTRPALPLGRGDLRGRHGCPAAPAGASGLTAPRGRGGSS